VIGDARLHEPAVEQVAADRYAAGREDVDVAAVRLRDGDIERAAAEIEDEEARAGRKLRFGGVVVGGADRLFEEPDLVDAGELPGFLEAAARGLVLLGVFGETDGAADDDTLDAGAEGTLVFLNDDGKKRLSDWKRRPGSLTSTMVKTSLRTTMSEKTILTSPR
jgi:hypothetical protein